MALMDQPRRSERIVAVQQLRQISRGIEQRSRRKPRRNRSRSPSVLPSLSQQDIEFAVSVESRRLHELVTDVARQYAIGGCRGRARPEVEDPVTRPGLGVPFVPVADMARLGPTDKPDGPANRLMDHLVALKTPAEIQARSVEFAGLIGRLCQTRPEPVGKPAVWARGRQALCETVPYFRSYQSSMYVNGPVVGGFLFDNASRPRDHLDDRVLISSIGGGMAGSGGSTSTGYTGMSGRAHSLMGIVESSISRRNPVVVISGNQNPSAISRLDRVYSVLDWFKPTDCWFEKINGQVIGRYRLELFYPTRTGWWTPAVGDDADRLGRFGPVEPAVRVQCRECNRTSPQVYAAGWMCLVPDCPAFWLMLGESGIGEPTEAQLAVYDVRFVRKITRWILDDGLEPGPPHSLVPSEVAEMAGPPARPGWRGIVCRSCGQCLSRVWWDRWECSLPDGCSAVVKCPPRLIQMADIRTFEQPRVRSIFDLSAAIDPALLTPDPYPITTKFGRETGTVGWPQLKDRIHPHVNQTSTPFRGFRAVRYTIPGLDECAVFHLLATDRPDRPGGTSPLAFADALLPVLQQQAGQVQMRRCRMVTTIIKGGMLTQHFAVNFGQPYAFSARVHTVPFPPSSVDGPGATEAKEMLEEVVAHLLTTDPIGCLRPFNGFNEMLMIGYFQDQTIGYHDDGEKGVGETIASVSVGAAGTMKLKLKDSAYSGLSDRSSSFPKLGRLPPLPSPLSLNGEIRTQLLTGSIPSGCPKEPVMSKGRSKSVVLFGHAWSFNKGPGPVLLELQLGHGDVVVMHGRELQQYCEHSVVHQGPLRFGLTARTIG